MIPLLVPVPRSLSRRALARLFPLALAATMGACGEPQASGPPNIRLGRDECAECGMIISENRYSASMVVDDRGVRTPLLFDDIGDLLDHERGHPDLRPLARYVHDHESRAWLDAAAASYVHADAIHTPMGSGLAACANRADAERLASQTGGRVMTFDEVRAFRQKWMEDRYGRPAGADAPPTAPPDGRDGRSPESP